MVFVFDIIVVSINVRDKKFENPNLLSVDASINNTPLQNLVECHSERSFEFAVEPEELRSNLESHPFKLQAKYANEVIGTAEMAWPSQVLTKLDDFTGEITHTGELTLRHEGQDDQVGTVEIFIRLQRKRQETRIQKGRQRFNQFLQRGHPYPIIFVLTVIVLLFAGVLQYLFKLKVAKRHCWVQTLELFCKDTKPTFPTFGILAALLVVMFLTFIGLKNAEWFKWFQELTQLELKKRFADFFFAQLIADIDKIEAKQMQRLKNNEIMFMRNFIKAHTDMGKTIAKTKQSARTRKPITPNDNKVTVPMSEIYDSLPKIKR